VLRFVKGGFLRSWRLAAIAIFLFSLVAFQTSASVLMVYGEVHKQAFDERGRVFLDVNSQCVIGIDTNSEAAYCRYIHWQDGSNSWQEYWIGAGHQRGIWTIPSTPPSETEKMKLKISGSSGNPEGSKIIPYSPGAKFGAASVSSAVFAHDVQPRWASDEVQSIGLALLNSNVVAFALEQGGLLAPWMEGACKDEACATTKVLYGAFALDWPESIEFHWNETAWRQQMADMGRKDAKSIKSTRSDGALLFRLSVTNWFKAGPMSVPSEWRTDLYSPRPILPMYHLQSILFHATNITWAGKFPEAIIPPGIALRDCRPSDQEHRGLTIMYLPNATNSLLSDTSATYKTLVADALYYNNNSTRQDLGMPALDRNGIPWGARPKRRRIIIWMLFVPLLLPILVWWRFKRVQQPAV
jgi:hypothetical protein